jgi:hypothetical protein
MGCKLVLFCLIPFLVYQENDLSRFLNGVNGKIIHVRSFQAVLGQVKNEQVSECPGIIVAVFSVKGEQLSLNAYSSREAIRNELSPNLKMCTVCFLINHKIFVYNGEPVGH